MKYETKLITPYNPDVHIDANSQNGMSRLRLAAYYLQNARNGVTCIDLLPHLSDNYIDLFTTPSYYVMYRTADDIPVAIIVFVRTDVNRYVVLLAFSCDPDYGFSRICQLMTRISKNVCTDGDEIRQWLKTNSKLPQNKEISLIEQILNTQNVCTTTNAIHGMIKSIPETCDPTVLNIRYLAVFDITTTLRDIHACITRQMELDNWKLTHIISLISDLSYGYAVSNTGYVCYVVIDAEKPVALVVSHDTTDKLLFMCSLHDAYPMTRIWKILYDTEHIQENTVISYIPGVLPTNTISEIDKARRDSLRVK